MGRRPSQGGWRHAPAQDGQAIRPGWPQRMPNARTFVQQCQPMLLPSGRKVANPAGCGSGQCWAVPGDAARGCAF